MDHAAVLTDGNEGTGEAADIGGGHDAALFDLVVEQSQGCGGSGSAGTFKAHLAEDICYAVADSRCGRQREVNDAEGNAQSAGSLACDELADTGDFKGGFFDSFTEDFKVLAVDFFQGALDNAGAADTDVEDAVGLGDAVEGACHEGVVIGCVAENNKFGAAEGIAVGCALGGSLDDAAHEADSVHINAGLGGADVDAGADDVCLGKGVRDGLDQHAVRRSHSLGYKGGIAAQEVYADLFGGAVQGLGNRNKIIAAVAGAAAHDCRRGDGNTLVDDRYAVFSGDLFAGAHQVAGAGGYLVIYFRPKTSKIRIRTVQEADAHCNGADIQVFPVDHSIGFGYFRKIDHIDPPEFYILWKHIWGDEETGDGSLSLLSLGETENRPLSPFMSLLSLQILCMRSKISSFWQRIWTPIFSSPILASSSAMTPKGFSGSVTSMIIIMLK